MVKKKILIKSGFILKKVLKILKITYYLFFAQYLVPYSSKYRSDIFKDFGYIINKLDENKKKTMAKEELIELIKLVYLMNPEGKGKQRKRTLEEVIDIINEKE